jgi:putative membrane protein
MDASLKLYGIFLAIIVVMWLIGLFVYTLITPQREFKLINEGNRAAAISLSGTAIALAAVLCAAGSLSSSIDDLLRMGAIAVVAQLVAFVVVALILKDFRKGIADDKLSYGLTLAGFSVAIGLLNIGAMFSLVSGG